MLIIDQIKSFIIFNFCRFRIWLVRIRSIWSVCTSVLVWLSLCTRLWEMSKLRWW